MVPGKIISSEKYFSNATVYKCFEAIKLCARQFPHGIFLFGIGKRLRKET
jgi:hypothetical protein